MDRIIEQKFYDLDVKVTKIQTQLSNFRRKQKRRRERQPLMHLSECLEVRDLLQCQ